jgi:hypothetical protein
LQSVNHSVVAPENRQHPGKEVAVVRDFKLSISQSDVSSRRRQLSRAFLRRCGVYQGVLAVARQCFATPPLVTGAVPTADMGTFEWYLGGLYEKGTGGQIARGLPATEVIYGLTDRQEINLELSGLSMDLHYGASDAVVGTKYLLLREMARRPGIFGSLELKLPTGNQDLGLGGGEFDYEFRLRVPKTWGWFTAIGNVGDTIVTNPVIGRVGTRLENVWFLSCAPE